MPNKLLPSDFEKNPPTTNNPLPLAYHTQQLLHMNSFNPQNPVCTIPLIYSRLLHSMTTRIVLQAIHVEPNYSFTETFLFT